MLLNWLSHSFVRNYFVFDIVTWLSHSFVRNYLVSDIVTLAIAFFVRLLHFTTQLLLMLFSGISWELPLFDACHWELVIPQINN